MLYSFTWDFLLKGGAYIVNRFDSLTADIHSCYPWSSFSVWEYAFGLPLYLGSVLDEVR